MLWISRKLATRLFYDGEEGAQDNEGGDAGQSSGGQDMIPKSEMDKHLAGLRRKNDATVAELKNAMKEQEATISKLKSVTTDPGEVANLQEEIERLQSKYMTEAEIAERDRQKKETELSSQIERLTKERDDYSSRFRNEVETSQFVTESARYEAFDPSHIASILKPDTEWKKVEREDGSHDLAPRVNFRDKDKDGKPVTLEVTIGDAIKMMVERPDRFGHLFRSTMKEGLSGSKNSGANNVSDETLALDPAKYREARKNNPKLAAQMMARAMGNS